MFEYSWCRCKKIVLIQNVNASDLAVSTEKNQKLQQFKGYVLRIEMLDLIGLSTDLPSKKQQTRNKLIFVTCVAAIMFSL